MMFTLGTVVMTGAVALLIGIVLGFALCAYGISLFKKVGDD
jgi:hypothetical protein